MVKETKIGLLAGLAFIICFAIILSNRGPREVLRYAVPDFADARNTAPAEARLPEDSVKALTVRSPAEPYRGGPAAPPSSGADVLAVDTPEDEAPPRPVETDATADARTEPRPVSPADQPQELASTRRALQQRLQQLRNGSDRAPAAKAPAESEDSRLSRNEATGRETRSRAAAPTDSSPAPAAAAARTAVYQVRPGDTLSRIAGIHYGSRSPRFVNGIVDANRGRITDPDVVNVGDELVLPVIDGVLPAGAHQPQRRNDPPQPRRVESRTSAQRGFRWYQIRKNDRYVSIAREQLGDGSRWREIYEMNKDKFPDPGLIREGVRIKLPADSVASLGAEGRP